MERKIHVLPDELTLQIAAGEVIERPASILKELLENALDAGATAVRVDLAGGGCGHIRIQDNGSGITRAEAPLAFERFATSKIERFDDLYGVASYGFRGEALPSIASIARVEMVTKTREALSGTRIVAEAGRVQEIADVGCPAGTSILISRIFENVPVRRKFLKSEATEQGYCMDVVHCAALASESLKIDVTAGGRSLFSMPATSRPDERVALVLGKDALDHLVPVGGTKEDGLGLRGFVSKPDWSRSSARHIYCFINRRCVRDALINHAVMTACRNVLEAKRYPVAVLHIELPPGAVDVNVHPAKMEVRFQDPRSVYGLVVESVLHGLAGVPAEPSGKPVERSIPSAVYQSRVEEAIKRYHLHTGGAKLTFKPRPAPGPFAQPSLLKPTEKVEAAEEIPPTAPAGVRFTELAFVGQAMGTYLVFEGPDGLILVDQHAAHERILFEKIQRRIEKEGMIGQQLLMPEIMTLSPRDYAIVADYLELLGEMGVDAEPFGENTITVKTVPAMLPDLDPVGMIRDIVDDAAGMEHSAHLRAKRDRLVAILACRGAVKAKNALSAAEVDALCKELDETAFSASCPHGRPTFTAVSRKDLERMFKRR